MPDGYFCWGPFRPQRALRPPPKGFFFPRRPFMSPTFRGFPPAPHPQKFFSTGLFCRQGFSFLKKSVFPPKRFSPVPLFLSLAGGLLFYRGPLFSPRWGFFPEGVFSPKKYFLPPRVVSPDGGFRFGFFSAPQRGFTFHRPLFSPPTELSRRVWFWGQKGVFFFSPPRGPLGPPTGFPTPGFFIFFRFYFFRPLFPAKPVFSHAGF